MGMFSVKILVLKIIMVVVYYGLQLAQRLGLAAPAYYKQMVQPLILLRVSIACNMAGSLIGGLGCVLGCGI